jgi:hypothetical protein
MKLVSLLACLLAALPAAALADTHGGDHAYARSGAEPSRAYQPAPHYQQSAPRYQQQPATRYEESVTRSQQPMHFQQPAPQYHMPVTGYRNVQAMPHYQTRPVVTHVSYYGGGYGGGYAGYHAAYQPGIHIFYNGYIGRPWGWNGGSVWVASPVYWGGGFWGGLGLGLALNDYAVQPSSPGYDLLSAYGLQQTDCDQPNLVQIYGPDGSQVCAFPNDQVGPGAYQVDPSTLTLVSE